MGTHYSVHGNIKLKPDVDRETIEQTLSDAVDDGLWDCCHVELNSDGTLHFNIFGGRAYASCTKLDEALRTFCDKFASEAVSCEFEFEGDRGIQYFGPNPLLAEFKDLDIELASLLKRRNELREKIQNGNS